MRERSVASMDWPDAAWLQGEYADGCDLVPSCFTCPLPACRYELPPGQARAWLTAMRLREALPEGLTMEQAAKRIGVSRRTVYRLRDMVNRQGGTNDER